jgi:hypothetical protein
VRRAAAALVCVIGCRAAERPSPVPAATEIVIGVDLAGCRWVDAGDGAASCIGAREWHAR